MRAMSLGETLVKQLSRRLLLLEGDHVTVGSQWDLGRVGVQEKRLDYYAGCV